MEANDPATLNEGKKSFVLGVVDTTGMKSSNLNRKRRWDQPPDEPEAIPTKVVITDADDDDGSEVFQLASTTELSGEIKTAHDSLMPKENVCDITLSESTSTARNEIASVSISQIKMQTESAVTEDSNCIENVSIELVSSSTKDETDNVDTSRIDLNSIPTPPPLNNIPKISDADSNPANPKDGVETVSKSVQDEINLNDIQSKESERKSNEPISKNESSHVTGQVHGIISDSLKQIQFCYDEGDSNSSGGSLVYKDAEGDPQTVENINSERETNDTKDILVEDSAQKEEENVESRFSTVLAAGRGNKKSRSPSPVLEIEVKKLKNQSPTQEEEQQKNRSPTPVLDTEEEIRKDRNPSPELLLEVENIKNPSPAPELAIVEEKTKSRSPTPELTVIEDKKCPSPRPVQEETSPCPDADQDENKESSTPSSVHGIREGTNKSSTPSPVHDVQEEKQKSPTPAIPDEKQKSRSPTPILDAQEEKQKSRSPSPVPAIPEKKQKSQSPTPVLVAQEEKQKSPSPTPVPDAQEEKQASPSPVPAIPEKKQKSLSPTPVLVAQEEKQSSPCSAPAISEDKLKSRSPTPVLPTQVEKQRSHSPALEGKQKSLPNLSPPSDDVTEVNSEHSIINELDDTAETERGAGSSCTSTPLQDSIASNDIAENGKVTVPKSNVKERIDDIKNEAGSTVHDHLSKVGDSSLMALNENEQTNVKTASDKHNENESDPSTEQRKDVVKIGDDGTLSVATGVVSGVTDKQPDDQTKLDMESSSVQSSTEIVSLANQESTVAEDTSDEAPVTHHAQMEQTNLISMENSQNCVGFDELSNLEKGSEKSPDLNLKFSESSSESEKDQSNEQSSEVTMHFASLRTQDHVEDESASGDSLNDLPKDESASAVEAILSTDPDNSNKTAEFDDQVKMDSNTMEMLDSLVRRSSMDDPRAHLAEGMLSEDSLINEINQLPDKEEDNSTKPSDETKALKPPPSEAVSSGSSDEPSETLVPDNAGETQAKVTSEANKPKVVKSTVTKTEDKRDKSESQATIEEEVSQNAEEEPKHVSPANIIEVIFGSEQECSIPPISSGDCDKQDKVAQDSKDETLSIVTTTVCDVDEGSTAQTIVSDKSPGGSVIQLDNEEIEMANAEIVMVDPTKPLSGEDTDNDAEEVSKSQKDKTDENSTSMLKNESPKLNRDTVEIKLEIAPSKVVDSGKIPVDKNSLVSPQLSKTKESDNEVLNKETIDKVESEDSKSKVIADSPLSVEEKQTGASLRNEIIESDKAKEDLGVSPSTADEASKLKSENKSLKNVLDVSLTSAVLIDSAVTLTKREDSNDMLGKDTNKLKSPTSGDCVINEPNIPREKDSSEMVPISAESKPPTVKDDDSGTTSSNVVEKEVATKVVVKHAKGLKKSTERNISLKSKVEMKPDKKFIASSLSGGSKVTILSSEITKTAKLESKPLGKALTDDLMEVDKSNKLKEKLASETMDVKQQNVPLEVDVSMGKEDLKKSPDVVSVKEPSVPVLIIKKQSLPSKKDGDKNSKEMLLTCSPKSVESVVNDSVPASPKKSLSENLQTDAVHEQNVESYSPKHSPITLRIYKDNLTVKTDLDSPKRNKSPLSSEFKSELSPHLRSPESLSPQTKQLEFTLKIAKDANTNFPKATMSPKQVASPTSIWKSEVQIVDTPSAPQKAEDSVEKVNVTPVRGRGRGRARGGRRGAIGSTRGRKLIATPQITTLSDSLDISDIVIKQETLTPDLSQEGESSSTTKSSMSQQDGKFHDMFKQMLNRDSPGSLTIETPPPVVKKRGRPRKIRPPMLSEMTPDLCLVKSEPSETPNSEGSDASKSGRPKRTCRGRTKPIVINKRRKRGGMGAAGLQRDMSTPGSVEIKQEAMDTTSEPVTPTGTDVTLEATSSIASTPTSIPPQTPTTSLGIAPPAPTRGRGNFKRPTPDRNTLSEKELAELQKIEERKEKLRLDRMAKYEAKKAKKLAKKLKDEERRKRVAREKAEKAEAAAPQVFEEETRMSAPDSCSRGHTPAPNRLGASDGIGDESQNSFSTPGDTSKNYKKARMEISLNDLDCLVKEVRVDDLAEYQWQGSELYMIQEQVSLYLGVKSFKRKYPGLKRRTVEAEERTFLEDSGLVPKSMCDLGLTAVSSAEILDIMFQDFPEKYEEFRKHVRDKQAREASFKQKAAIGLQKKDGTKVEPREQALEAVAAWNANLNRERREERRCALDLQTFTVHYPKVDRDTMKKPTPKIGLYPVAVIPGQFCDHYKKYTPTDLMYFPINTVLCGPLKPHEKHRESSDDGSGSDSSSSSSSSSSSGDSSSESESEGEDTAKCKVCNGTKKKNKESLPEILLSCVQCKTNYHPSCKEFTPEMTPHLSKYDWQCTTCKKCNKCRDPNLKDRIMACQLCDRGYHLTCIGLKKMPEGRWHCTICAYCSSCDSRNPGGSDWQHEFKKGEKGVKIYQRTLCTPCFKLWRKGKYCQLCFKCHSIKPEEDPNLIQCNGCERWLHKECYGNKYGIQNKLLSSGTSIQCDFCVERIQSSLPSHGVNRSLIKV